MIGAALLLTACATVPANDRSAFRESRPRSILIMPPINRSPDINAPAVFLATAARPLAEAGYYVIPVALSTETFRQNGITVAEQAHAISPYRLREIFGADAALYITITRFGPTFYGFASVIEAWATAKLVDLRSGQLLWSGEVRESQTSHRRRGGTSHFSHLLAIVFVAAVDQVLNTVFDTSFDVGRQANHHLLSAGRRDSILFGPYHPRFGTD